jgi:hypothetical protein
MRTLILNSSNVVAGSNNSKFLYSFPQGGYVFKDDLIAIQEISMYFSTFNITTAYNNNSFSYIWIDGTTHIVNIPNSFLQVSELNELLQSVMISNTHYLVNSTTNEFVYLLEMVVNQPQYAVQLNEYVINTALATANTWVLPSGATWVLPTNLICPYFVIPSNNFGKLIGFVAGQYPSGAITGTPPAQIQTPAFSGAQSQLSSIAPQITPYSSFLVFCSLVNNRAVIPSQLIYTLTPTGATFGALQSYQPTAELGWNKIEDGNYTSFTIEFRDQLGNPISIQDPNTTITLYTKNRNDASPYDTQSRLAGMMAVGGK